MEIEEPAEIRVSPSPPRPFVLGINYWPRRKAMYWWKEFDTGEVRDELGEVADLGAQVVRVFLLWEDFQPSPWTVDTRRLGDLVRVLDLAHGVGLQVMPTLFTGNMSGVFWLPPWAISERPLARAALVRVGNGYSDREPLNPFENPFMLRAQLFQIRTVVPVLAGHPAIFGWDLSNELDEVHNPGSFHGGWLWSYLLSEEVRKLDPQHPVTYGAHTPSLSRYNGLSVGDLAETNDYLSMHGYPLYSDVARGPVDSDFVPFLNQLTEHLGAKPTLFQEFGLCTAQPGQPGGYIEDEFLGERRQQYLAGEEEGGSYYREVLEKLHRAGSLGAFAWCFGDYDPSIWDRPPLDRAIRERSFGITRADGSLKPAGAEFQRFARRLRKGDLQGWGAEKVTFPISTEQYYRDPTRHFREMYHWYLEKRRQAAGR